MKKLILIIIILLLTSSVEAVNWPLKINSGGRYLEDQDGIPFPVIGDTAWSLAVQLGPSDVITYLNDRQSKGFNTIMVNITDRTEGTYAPNNYNNDAPFTNGPGDWSIRNEAYWTYVDYIFNQAKIRNMLVLAFPAYLGYACGSDGWCSIMQAQTDAVMTNYGIFLGNRYKNQGNIIWSHGGDTNCNNHTNACARVAAIANGIKAYDSNHLHTAHSIRPRSAMDDYNSIVDINTAYVVPTDLASEIQQEYQRSGAKPLFLIEGWYENEHSTTILEWQLQNLVPILGGTFGSMFGNCPIWLFGFNPSVCGTSDWAGNLNSTGSITTSYIGKLIKSRKWWGFVPDYSNVVVTSSKGSGTTYHATARETSGETVVVWCPDTNQVTVDMTKISGATANAWWWNPDDNSSVLDGTYSTTGTRNFTPASARKVLVLDDASKGLSAPGTTNYYALSVVKGLTIQGGILK